MVCFVLLFDLFLAEAEPSEGKRKVEALWPIIRINHERSRYIYEMYYKKKAISKACYDFCLKNGYADANLIAKWKKVYSKLLHFVVYCKQSYREKKNEIKLHIIKIKCREMKRVLS